MPVPAVFAAKSADLIKDELLGFPPSTVEAAVAYHQDAEFDTFLGMLPGMIEFHLPRGTAKPPAILTDELRLNQDLGLDSLALTEMAFKLDDLLGVSIETREAIDIVTVGELKTFLKAKLEAA